MVNCFLVAVVVAASAVFVFVCCCCLVVLSIIVVAADGHDYVDGDGDDVIIDIVVSGMRGENDYDDDAVVLYLSSSLSQSADRGPVFVVVGCGACGCGIR